MLDVSKIPQQMTEVTTLQTELEHKLSIFEEKGVADKRIYLLYGIVRLIFGNAFVR